MAINLAEILPGNYYEFFKTLSVDICRQYNVPLKSGEKYRKLEDARLSFEPLTPIIDSYLFSHANTRFFEEWLELNAMFNIKENTYDAFPTVVFDTLCWMHVINDTKFVNNEKLENFVNILEFWRPVNSKMDNNRLTVLYKVEKLFKE